MTDIVNGLLVRDQHVLMAHRSPLRRTYPGTWSFPGGHVEDGETLEQALQRELHEEIEVLAQSWSFMKQFDDVAGGPSRKVSFHCFAVTQWQGEPRNIGSEHTEIKWVRLHDAIHMSDLTFPSYVALFEALKTA